MPDKTFTDPYKNVSSIYTHLMSSVNYKFWAKYIIRITRKYLSPTSSVLEIAAGNGRLSEYLIKIYPDYILSDLSPSMLKSANKIDKPLVCCDMMDLPFNKKFDMILCTFDSINYLTNKSKLIRLFQEVADHLSENGIFVFDVGLIRNSIKHSKTASKKGRFNDQVYYRESVFYPKSGFHKNKFKIIDSGGNVLTEVHTQKIYPFNLYFELLNKSGLYVIECFKAFTKFEANHKSERVQFIVKRAN